MVPDPETTAASSETVAQPGPEVPTAAIPASPPAAPRGSRVRWIVAAIVVVAVVGGVLAAALLLGAKPLPEAFRYLPADSVVVVELRPELPGDQRQHLGNFLAHFPGFADQSILSDKIDEALDRLIRSGTDGKVDYTTQVKPLMAGPTTAAMTPADLADLSAGRTPSNLLLVATTDGKATCQSIFGGLATTGDTHRNVQLYELGDHMSCGLDGRFLLLGGATAISAGLDTRADGKGIDGDPTFRSARERLSGDQLAVFYLHGKGLAGALASMAPSLGVDAALGSGVPDWLIGGVRVVDDAIQIETISPPIAAKDLASGTPTDPPPDKSHFATMLPADAFGFLEAHGAGANVQRLIAQLKADPAQAEAVASFEQSLAAVGGVDNLTGWIEDLGVAGVPVEDSAGAIVLMRGTDAAATRSRFDQIRNLLVLASTGTDITLETADHNGVAVTTVDLGDLGPTLEAFGLPVGTLPSGASVKFAMATRDDVLMLGIGDGVIERVLDVDAASSLATSAGYGRAIGLASSPNDLEAYVAVDALAAWIEAQVPAGADLEAYRRDAKPYLEHLAAVVASSVTTSTESRARIILTVK
jgi:hypothetical protein